MPLNPEDVKWAADAFTLNVQDYIKARDYYHGKQELSFASPRFQTAFGQLLKPFAYNRCRPVVDAMANKLKVKGFNIQGVNLQNLSFMPLAEADYAQQAMTLWKLAGMTRREGELYTEAGVTGDAYGVVYYDAPRPLGTGLPRLYPNKADVMRVRYDDDGRIVLAAKSWLQVGGPNDKKRRLTIYTANEIFKLITVDTAEAEMPKELEKYEPYKEVNGLGQRVAWPIVHNLGRVPVVHYANNAPMVGDFGISELKDVIPLQDALNKSVADMLVAMEYNAFQQRWAIGIEGPEIDEQGNKVMPFKQGPGELWWSTNADAKFGDFTTADLKQFLAAQDQFDLDIARVSHTPVHWLIMTGTPPSGESIKVSVEPFTDKIEDRQTGWGAEHATAMSLMFQLSGIGTDFLIEPEWEEAAPRSEREQAEIGKMMADAGVPLEIAARVMGLEEEELARLAEIEEEKATSREQAIAQMSGLAMQDRLSRDAQGSASMSA